LRHNNQKETQAKKITNFISEFNITLYTDYMADYINALCRLTASAKFSLATVSLHDRNESDTVLTSFISTYVIKNGLKSENARAYKSRHVFQ